jgi:hypothetical protein
MIISRRIIEYRSRTYRTAGRLRITTKEDAIQFVNQRGFIFFWPIKNIVLPSLWVSVVGDRPVADQHDDPGHVTWGWKDSLLGSQHWYYAKVLRKRATIISMEVAPYFYALSMNYGSPEEDYLFLYERGHMTQEAKTVYKLLLEQGPMDTIALRRASYMTSKESDSRFNRALMDLQADFKIVPVGVTQSGGWRYAFAYDLVSRHYPALLERSRYIRECQAREKLMELYFHSVGAAKLNDVVKIFQWSIDNTKRTLMVLEKRSVIQQGLQHEDQPGEWIALNELT